MDLSLEMPQNGILRLDALHADVRAARILLWPNLEHRACPVCHASNHALVAIRPDGLAVAKCFTCEMLFLPNVPSEESLARFYAGYSDFKDLTKGRKRSALRNYLAALFDLHISILVQSGGLQNQVLCEVGASYGRFLTLARARGSAVHAVEIDQQASDYLSRIAIPATQVLPTSGQFDVICAFQVIEHLISPGSLIERCSAALKPDGRLLLSMPNGGDAERVGAAWLGFRVDLEHLNYFSVKTLATLLYEHGLYVEQYWEHGQPSLSRDPSSNTTSVLTPLKMLANRLLGVGAGTFVLTVLARKAK